MHERVRDRLLGAWARRVTTFPLPTLIVCLCLAAVGVVLAITQLEFHSERSRLIDPDQPWNKRYTAYKEDFPRWDDSIVVFADFSEDDRIDQLTREIAAAFQSDPRVDAANAGFDVLDASPRLFRALPQKEFEQTIEELTDARRLIAVENANGGLGVLTSTLQVDQQLGSVDALHEILQPYLDALNGQKPDFSFLTSPAKSDWHPFASTNNRLRYVRVQFAASDKAGVNIAGERLEWLRGRIEELVEASDRPDIRWGVTGVPTIEADETTQSIRDSTIASIVAFVLITILMIAVFRGVRVPLFAAAALLIGLAWSFGWLILAVGHLQVLSVVFSAILLGLGVDFAMHLVARLELVHEPDLPLPDAMSRAFRTVGPGMITGAVTTAAAFAATVLTDFRGMSEMGIIAGGGILLCLVAMLCAFPAMLALTGQWRKIIRDRPGGENAHFAGGRFDVMDRRPIMTLAVVVLIAIFCFLAATKVQYNPNVLDLAPPGIESVQWEQRIVREENRSVWAAVVLAAPSEAPERVAQLRNLDGVSEVGGMGDFLPTNRRQRAEAARSLFIQSIRPPELPAGIPILRVQLESIRAGLLIEAERRAAEIGDQLREIAEAIQNTLGEAKQRSDEQLQQSWRALNAVFTRAQRELTSQVEAALAPGPITATDLPPALKNELIGQSGQSKLLVYPTSDPQGRSILHPDRLEPFVKSVRSVAPEVLGPPVQIYESSQLIIREYIKAACYALAAILVLLLLDFRSLADSLSALVPVGVGFLGTFGMMGVFGLSLNFANIIVLPLIFGIGVDAGVHIVHRWREQPGGIPAGLSGATGRGITITLLTTMIGFGSLLAAQHRGIQSLAIVMIVGLSVTLLACYTVLPALLRLRSPH